MCDPQRDALYGYDADAQKSIQTARPWLRDPHYFKTVRISAVAMVKMVMHARSGGSIEVMGLMQGYVQGSEMVVTDAYRLPVEGTETRVNAHEDANEYMVEYLRLSREEGRKENVIGWYHSHPGYGCWLSGIDVSTQHLQQQFNEPFVAVVIDPDRTISANKVEIGAFRTYPENYKPSENGGSSGPGGYQMVPLNKAEDFGAHSSRYYSLTVEHFKSTLDTMLLESLWGKYWVQTLTQNPLLTNRDFSSSQMADLGHKINEVANAVKQGGRGGGATPSSSAKAVDQAADKVLQDLKGVAAKEVGGLSGGGIKANVFNGSE